LGERKGLGEAKTPLHSKNHHFISPIRDVLSPGRDNPSSGYEATRMWNTRNSLFWGWRRVEEYFRDLGGMNYQKEVYALMAN